MNAHAFFEQFQKIFEKDFPEAQTAYCDNTLFTKFITRKINAILSNHEQNSQNEYFRIDAISWTAKADMIEKPEQIHLNKHLWDLEIAVEHENDAKDWMDEVVKLAHIVCPLRVVIGYMPADQRQKDLLYLNYISRWLQELQCADNMRRGEYLVILGNSKTGGKPEQFFHYKGYLFHPEKFCFVPLETA